MRATNYKQRLIENILSAPMLAVFAAIATGILADDLLQISVEFLALALCGLLLLLRRAINRRCGTFIVTWFGFILLGAFLAATDELPPPIQVHCIDATDYWHARVARVVGRVTSPTTNNMGRLVHLDLLAQRCGETWLARTGRVSIKLWQNERIASGDEITLRLTIEPLTLRRNPTDPDPKIIARRDGLSGRAIAKSPYAFTKRAQSLSAFIDRARDSSSERFENHFEAKHSAIAKALSNGDQNAINAEMREYWSVSGLTHLLSVSGLHITLIATLVFIIVSQLLLLIPRFAERWSVRRVAAIIAIPLIILFCCWAGSPSPAVRATIMGVAFLCGIAIGRPSSVINAVGIAGVLILIIMPVSLYDLSFIFSFVSILFLLLLPRLKTSQNLWHRLGRFAANLILASIVATLATLPIAAYYFGRVSLIAPLANLIGVPIGSAVATPGALLYSLIAPISEMLEQILRIGLKTTLIVLDSLITYLGSKTWSAIDVAAPTYFEMIVYYIGLLTIVIKPKKRLAQYIGIVVCVIVCSSYYWRLGPGHHHNGKLVVQQLYVGQGDAALIQLPDREVILIDAGGSLNAKGFDPGQQTVAPMMRRLGIRTIDLAMVSHPHPDHLEGFAYIAKHFKIKELWWSGNGADLPTMKLLIKAVKENGGIIKLSAQLAKIQKRGNTTIELYHPGHNNDEDKSLFDPTLNDNENSIVLRLQYKKYSILFTGDIEANTESKLSERVPVVDVIKVPHHGSNTSSTRKFITALKPKVAIISVGANNRFNFPRAEVIERYQTYNAEIFRTDQDGMIEIVTDGNSIIINTNSGRRYEIP
ncbi:MAG: DNA internalization-related competence protein ComEC/Rec2 [Deltaproteobacteria bacterium]|nr:DNA internalization-related competence protein ComEC/Rec2 [Deltaproteobacteria bacterium]